MGFYDEPEESLRNQRILKTVNIETQISRETLYSPPPNQNQWKLEVNGSF